MSVPVNIAALIDHTLLAPTATHERVLALCDEAISYGFATVCVNGVWVREAAARLSRSTVAVCSVVGFPLGANATAAKVYEAETAIADGASELDMVLDLGGLKSGDDARVVADVAAVARVAHAAGARVKVILETSALCPAEKVRACELAVRGNADFVKTSTGFGSGGATIEDVALMRRTVGPFVGVKASGGIRTLADARAMIAAGANRIGTSSGVAIVTGQ